MSPHLTIITAAMSLGGMASVGFNHYGQVEQQVANYHSQKEEQQARAEVAEVGERVEVALSEVKDEMKTEMSKAREEYVSMLKDVVTDVELVKEQQSSHNVLMSRLAQDQDSLEFKVESFSDQFRPLRATGSRFLKVKTESSEAHPLLPPVDSSWTDDY